MGPQGPHNRGQRAKRRVRRQRATEGTHILTDPRAIIIAAALVSLAMLAQALLPRYELRVIDSAGYARVDHWTERCEMATVVDPDFTVVAKIRKAIWARR